MSARNVCLTLVSTSLVAGVVIAAEPTEVGLDYVLRAGATYSDNIVLRPSPLDEPASALAFGVEVRGERPSGRLRYETEVDLWRYQYLEFYSGGQTFGRGLLRGSYDIVPDHFRWNASVNFDQQREDLARPLIPGNVEDLFTLSTGPTFRALLFGAVDTLADAHIVQALYSGNSFDSQTLGGRLELGHRTGRESRLALGGSIDDVTYLSGQASSLLDFQRREAFVHGDLTGVRTTVSAELGYAEAVGGTFDGNGPLARIRVERKMSPSLSAYLGYRHEFPTSQVSQPVSGGTPAGGGVVNTALVTSAPRESWTGEFGFRYRHTRSEGELGYYHVNEDSLIPLLGSHSYDELRASVKRYLTPRSSGAVFASYSREDFSAFTAKFDDLEAGVTYSYEFTRSIGLDVRVEYKNRNSNDPSLSYNELNGGVFIRYSGSMLGRSVATPQAKPTR
jgi:hypothetical protein